MEQNVSLAMPGNLSASQELATWQQERSTNQLQSFVERKLQQLASELEFNIDLA